MIEQKYLLSYRIQRNSNTSKILNEGHQFLQSLMQKLDLQTILPENDCKDVIDAKR